VVGELLEGRYRVRGKLGAGGMGEVFAVEDGDGRTLALKILHRFLARDAEFAARFRREARAIARLAHSHLVAIHDVGVLADGRPYLAMELVAGQSLAERLRQRGRPPLPWSLRLLAQLAAAIDHAHARGVLHRDLKPENLMLRAGSDELVVLDFGLAKIVAPDYAESLGATPLGDVLASAAYMAPEQLFAGAVPLPLDGRCDLYAIGCIGYELATGAPPFSGGRVDLMHAHLSLAPVAPRARCPEAEIPPALEALLLRCLAKEPARRFQSGRELEQAIAAI
jgi:serine/threonine-protein kinase